MPVSIKVPKTLVSSLYPGEEFDGFDDAQLTHIKSVAKQLIERAIAGELLPSTVNMETEHDYVGHMTINVLPKYNRTLITYSKEKQQPVGAIALSVLVSAINQDWHLEYCKTRKTSLAAYVEALGYDSRDEQERFYSYVDDVVAESKVGLIEASTGVGKTLAILASANESSRSSSVSVIATNTISNMMAYLSDYEALRRAGVDLSPIFILLGRQNFVSVARLMAWVEGDGRRVSIDDVERWIADGGRTQEDGEAVPSFTLESLMRVCPEVVPSEVQLTVYESSLDEGAKSYAAQFTKAFSATSGILLVSHMMLCLDMRMRLLRHGLDGDVALTLDAFAKRVDDAYRAYVDRGASDGVELLDNYLSLSRSFRETRMAAIDESCVSLLPNYTYLYVDEGHLLESAMASVVSVSVSLKSLLRDVSAACERGLFPRVRLKEASSLVDRLVGLGDVGESGTVMLTNSTHEANAIIVRLCETLTGARAKKGNEAWLEQVAHLRRSVSFNQKGRLSLLEFSPVRAYPRVSVGEVDCSRYFKSMWARVKSAIVVSATLYIKRYNAYSCAYMRRLLSIDDIRLGEYPPVHAKWIKTTVKTVYVPAKFNEKDSSLMPVGRQFRGTEDELMFAKEVWCRALSERILHAYDKAAGGVLVLMTSYEELALLVSFLPPSIPIVYASSDNTLSEQKAEFVRLSKLGQKPLWVSLGGAWVGMDVSGRDVGLTKEQVPELDNVLTTLVIAKIPFGLNKTLSHSIRAVRDTYQGDVELMDTLMRLKQGLGRLVRLENQPKNREIYLLDARFTHPRYRGFLAPVKALFETYPHVEYLESE